MQAHAHRDRAGRELLVGLLRRGRRSLCRRERDEERVALSVDLDAAVSGEGGSQRTAMLGERVGVGVRPERMEQPCRALDVGEEERHSAGRQVRPHDAVYRRAMAAYARRAASSTGRAQKLSGVEKISTSR